jgi:YfiH family protein
MLFPNDWIRPDWPAPPWVKAVFTTRQGGVSAPPFDSFNLGEHVRDAAGAVAGNRVRLAQALGQRPVFLQQVHGTAVLRVHAQTPDGAVADACLSTASGVACTVMVADCLPVLFAHRDARVVAAAHAGWRGLAGEHGQGILEHTWAHWLSALREQLPEVSSERLSADSLVWLGPCIGPAAFEVGGEVRQAFVAPHAQATACFVQSDVSGKWLADLPALARQRLRALGVSKVYGNDGSAAWCTVSQPSLFFSHRRDAGRLGSTGRLAACIGLD